MLLFTLYAARVLLGVYAYIIVCSINPNNSSGLLLIICNSLLIVASMLIYNTKHATADMVQLIAHSIGVITVAAASRNILFALVLQLIGTFTDVQRCMHQLLELHKEVIRK